MRPQWRKLTLFTVLPSEVDEDETEFFQAEEGDEDRDDIPAKVAKMEASPDEGDDDEGGDEEDEEEYECAQ